MKTGSPSAARAGLSALLMLVAGWTGLTAAEPDLTFGFTPVLGQAQTQSEFQPVTAYLSRAIGRKVSIRVTPRYGDLSALMDSGRVDIGSFSPFAYVSAARAGKIRLIGQSLIFHSATYRGLVIARKDSGLKDLRDLRGRRFAYVDPSSASGYVYPRAMLIERGFVPDRFLGPAVFAGDHRQVIADVLARKVDAGAIYDTALRVAGNEGMAVGELAVLATTEPIPHDAIAVRAGLDPGLVRRIQAALVNFEHTDEGREIIARSRKGLTGFQLADDRLYDSVRRTAAEAGL